MARVVLEGKLGWVRDEGVHADNFALPAVMLALPANSTADAIYHSTGQTCYTSHLVGVGTGLCVAVRMATLGLPALVLRSPTEMDLKTGSKNER